MRSKKILFFLIFFLFLSLLIFRGRRGRFNLLLLGIPGGDYPGSRLSDTIMVLSFSPRDLALISIPRDIWIEEFGQKINTLYARGGLSLAKEKIAQLLGIRIDGGVVINFLGFKKAIDLVGGIDVEVEHSFDDFYYPLPGKENDECGGDPQLRCRYEHLHFEKGKTHMDGDLALKFARSRQATNSAEGTDFARARRQQKIILAFREKFLSPRHLFQPQVLWGLWQISRSNLESDLGIREILSLILHLQWRNVRSFSLDWGRENKGGLLFNPPLEEYGTWVLVPRKDWGEIREELAKFLR